MPEIAFLMGKSSSGKDNIFKALVGDKELNLKTVIMYTTRPMRAGEKEGVEYYYVDNEKALELEAADKVIEMRIYMESGSILQLMMGRSGLEAVTSTLL